MNFKEYNKINLLAVVSVVILLAVAGFGYYYFFTGLPVNPAMYFADYPHESVSYSGYDFDERADSNTPVYGDNHPYTDIFGSKYAYISEVTTSEGEVTDKKLLSFDHNNNTQVFYDSEDETRILTENYTFYKTLGTPLSAGFATRYDSDRRVQLYASPVGNGIIFSPSKIRIDRIDSLDNVSYENTPDTIYRPLRKTQYSGRSAIVYKVDHKPSLNTELFDGVYSKLYVDEQTGMILKGKIVSPSNIHRYELRPSSVNLSDSRNLAKDVINSEKEYINLDLSYSQNTTGLKFVSYGSYPNLERDITVEVIKDGQNYSTEISNDRGDVGHLYVESGSLQYGDTVSNRSEVDLRNSRIKLQKGSYEIVDTNLSEDASIRDGYPLDLDFGETEDYLYIGYRDQIREDSLNIEFDKNSTRMSARSFRLPYGRTYFVNKSDIEYPMRFEIRATGSSSDKFLTEVVGLKSELESENNNQTRVIDQKIAEYVVRQDGTEMLDKHENVHINEDDHGVICFQYRYNIDDLSVDCSSSREMETLFDLNIDETELDSFDKLG